ncbi:hypothetical protein PL9214291353 [Planktothrix tepida PCC 9214]|uniref:Uncharacterized protein n=1 Tax=Planktothrix tepida PCC 9214 TaxID=671072 RepID=A0A1J1LH09_9CYAN|nr:hypothetical protein PL9214291353 [Planktothrix tepida PCC 9214]
MRAEERHLDTKLDDGVDALAVNESSNNYLNHHDPYILINKPLSILCYPLWYYNKSY